MLSILLAAVAQASDLGGDVSGAVTSGSENNPRAGSVGVGVTGAWDVTSSWALFGLGSYLRDLGTSTETTSSTGSNVFRLSLGAQWLPHPQWMAMLSVSGSPPATQVSATTRTVPDAFTGQPRTVDVVVDSVAWNLGAQALAAWTSAGTGPVQSTIDLGGGATRFDIFQRLRLGSGPAGEMVRSGCTRRDDPFCDLVAGASTPLWQARLAAGYTATLHDATDLGLELAGYLYDRDPADVGYFSVVAAGRQVDSLGSGVPVSPLRFTVRPSVSHRFSRVTLRAVYQGGLYASGLGALHAVTAKVTWKATAALRLSLTVTGQVDVDPSGLALNRGAAVTLGALYLF